jgi:hydrogenase nickel incorporation protein HypA/HybF
MHEASIAMAAIEQAVEVARQHGASRITRVALRVGALRQVMPEAMKLAFEACAIGTPVEGAELELREEPVVARCRPCGRQFEPDLQAISFACPQCGRADAELLAGNEIILTSVECEQDEEAAHS